MATYKVPQDVEADDKLLGPFSFRQFIYLMAAAFGIAIAWLLGNIFLPLFILPLPIILFFGALALPLKKDQPMEVYLAALVSFHLKPRKRIWQPDGITSLIEVTVPRTVEVQRTKDISRDEAARRLSYLADIVDTGGGAVRGVQAPPVNAAMNSEFYYEAQSTEDVFDAAAGIAKNFDTMIEKNDQVRRQAIIDRMHNPGLVPQGTTQTVAPSPTQAAATPTMQPTSATPAPDETANLKFNPYPDSIRQAVIQPLSSQPSTPAAQTTPASSAPQPATASSQPEPSQTTSVNEVSPDIINLANQNDLSIETIANEAKRIKAKQAEDGEVVISLR